MYHQYQYSLTLQCHSLMISISFKMISHILVIVICYQDQMMIWSLISISFWDSIISCPFLLCFYLQNKEPKDKKKLFPIAHRSSPKLSCPKCMILLWKVFSLVPSCWIHTKKMWQEVLFSCTNLCEFQWNNQPLCYHCHWIIQCSYCETRMIFIWLYHKRHSIIK